MTIDMRITASQSEPHRSPIANIPRRPRSGHRRRRNSFRFWEIGLVRNKESVNESQSEKWKGKRICEEEVKEKGGNVTDQNKEGLDLELLARVGDGAYENELERMTKGMTKEKGGNVTDQNKEGLDLELLARVGDGAYENELERMTKGMTRAVQLVGFMDTFEGNWCRGSQRRKLVAAADIVNVLPDDWKIEIAINCRDGLSSIHCRNYVSPTGMEFKSCKDVAVYLKDQSLIDIAGPSKQGEMRQINNGNSMLLESINEITSSPAFHEANNKLLPVTNDLYDVEIGSHIECPPCGLTFDDIDGLNKHLAICHKQTTRIFELPKKPNTLDKAQSDCGQNAVVGHDERRLGEASSSSQRTGGIESPAINVNSDGTFRTECIWCYKVFLSKPVDAESMADATGFMCPQCVELVCGGLEKSLSRCKMQ